MDQAGTAAGVSTQAGGLLTTMEMAVALRLGYAATLAAFKRGTVPARKIGKSYRVRREDLEALMTPPAMAPPVHRGAPQ